MTVIGPRQHRHRPRGTVSNGPFGIGFGDPLRARQRIRLSVSSGAVNFAEVKSCREDRIVSQSRIEDRLRLRIHLVEWDPLATESNAVKSGLSLKQSKRGVALASN